MVCTVHCQAVGFLYYPLLPSLRPPYYFPSHTDFMTNIYLSIKNIDLHEYDRCSLLKDNVGWILVSTNTSRKKTSASRSDRGSASLLSSLKNEHTCGHANGRTEHSLNLKLCSKFRIMNPILFLAFWLLQTFQV